MTQEEKFKIWDATSPEIREVKEYLNRLCGQTPLQLVFRNAGQTPVCSNTILAAHTFVGILVSKTVFFARGYTVKEVAKGERGVLKEVFAKDIFQWVQNNPLFPPNSRPMLEKDRRLLDHYAKDLYNTLEILKYHNLQMPYFRHEIGWLQGNDDSVFVSYSDGETRLNCYLAGYGDIWICNSDMNL